MRDTIDMAREAGMLVNTSRDSKDHLERLVALVRADEREACLKIADDCADADMHASMVANAIRARGQA